MLKYIGYSVGAITIAFVVYLVNVNLHEETQSNPIPMTQHNTAQTQYIADAVATFASGCFWCMESTMQETDGVVEVISGYAGGKEVEPTYEDVYKGKTGHREAVQVHYDSSVISYDELLAVFWQNIDPTDAEGQFSDKGFSYTTAIFYHDDAQEQKAKESKKALSEDARFEKEIATLILPYTTFYEAEEYHQDFYKKSSTRYKNYNNASGRKAFKESVWQDILAEQKKQAGEAVYQKPSDEELQRRLTDEQYQITQHDGTEKPYENAYWDNKEEGIYVDVVTDEPLFSSTDKYDSNTGWPSFTKPIKDINVVERPDLTLFLPRTEVRSASGDSHLGHIFNDGPQEAGGQRYCINSASLNFVPLDDMEQEGYGAYLYLFEK